MCSRKCVHLSVSGYLEKSCGAIFRLQKFSDPMLEFCVTGRFCRVLRVSHSKSASSFYRLYPRGQWINARGYCGSWRSLHTIISRRQDSQPIMPPGLQPSDWSPLNVDAEGSGASPLAERWQRHLVKHQTIHTQAHVQRAITCLLAAFC